MLLAKKSSGKISNEQLAKFRNRSCFNGENRLLYIGSSRRPEKVNKVFFICNMIELRKISFGNSTLKESVDSTKELLILF